MSYNDINTNIETFTYKEVKGVKLEADVYFPKDLPSNQKRPCIIFFFGGGWISGTRQQFREQCIYFALRGMVAITVDYRIMSLHHSTPVDSLEDAQSAIEWVVQNASNFKIDVDKIVVSGGSAGGMLAFTAAMQIGSDFLNDHVFKIVIPKTIVLFNPVNDTEVFIVKQKAFNLSQEIIKSISPINNINFSTPPVLLFHGTSDSIVECSQAVEFKKAMDRKERICKLVLVKGQGHGFFNYGRDDNKWFDFTLSEAEKFLKSQEIL